MQFPGESAPVSSAQATRIVVVTGASRGIGRAAVLALATAGSYVIAVARDSTKLEELAKVSASLSGNIEACPLDVRSHQGIRELADEIRDRWGRVDALVGNAGVFGEIGPVAELNEHKFRDTLDVNLLANWRFICEFDSLLRASKSGRVVMISSGASVHCCEHWGPYSISKAALDALVHTYAAETSSSPVRVMLVSPGPLSTDMRAYVMPEEDPLSLATPEDLAPWIVRLCSPKWDQTGKVFDFRIGKVVDRH